MDRGREEEIEVGANVRLELLIFIIYAMCLMHTALEHGNLADSYLIIATNKLSHKNSMSLHMDIHTLYAFIHSLTTHSFIQTKNSCECAHPHDTSVCVRSVSI